MLRNNPKITELMYESAIEKLASMKGMTLSESRAEVGKMSFMQYHTFLEASANITPPSGQAIGPSVGAASAPVTQGSPAATTQGPQKAPAKAQVMWAGQGSPIEQGMTVGLKGPNGLPVAGEITQVDQSANGVKVHNPTTGQEEWHGNDDLQPYVGGSTVPGATNQAAGLQQQQMAEDIKRIRQLAGIAEAGFPHNVDHMPGATRHDVAQKMKDAACKKCHGSGFVYKNQDGDVFPNNQPGTQRYKCGACKGIGSLAEDASGGASCAGGIAVAPAAMGSVKRRAMPENSMDEYTPTVAKTVVGDTKPHQDSGKLSARLAKAGKPTASRSNNGFKK